MNKLEQAVSTALKDFMGIKEGESVLIVIDETKRELGNKFLEIANSLNTETMLVEMKMRRNDGAQLPLAIAEAMKKVDAVIGITERSMTHTEARREANKLGVRVGTLPQITADALERCLSVDKEKLVKVTDRVTKVLTEGKVARLTSSLGTDITIPINGIEAISSTGVVVPGGKNANILSGEAYLMPEEGKSNGVVVVDGSVSNVGIATKDYVKITVKNGFAEKIEGGKNAEKLKEVLAPYGKEGLNLAELGVGTNPNARLTGKILEDEKIGGTVHIALGNNASMGGNFKVAVHIDCILMKPTLIVDDIVVVKDGKLLIS